jgi:hypothetical protein
VQFQQKNVQQQQKYNKKRQAQWRARKSYRKKSAQIKKRKKNAVAGRTALLYAK